MHNNEPAHMGKHTTPDEKCPFCPGTETETYTSHPGEKNDSKKLAAIMKKPAELVSKQGGARPKDGQAGRQPLPKAKAKPTPIYRSDTYGDYSCEAHHLISGNQVMDGQPVEKWICKGKGPIEKDTGYSINNSENGVWLPSIPEQSKPGGGGKLWGLLEDAEKYAIAVEAMAQGKGQFHKGPHDVVDPEDPVGTYHRTYVVTVREELQALHDLIEAFSAKCFLCEPNKKPPPPYKINELLDALSTEIEIHLLGLAPTWRYFISKVAMQYHKENCTCHDALIG